MTSSIESRRAFLAAALGVALFAGCTRYPRVSGGEGVKYIGALRTACSSKSVGRLDNAVEAIEEARRAGRVTDAEHAAFASIIELARGGKWKDAEMAAYAFQKAQVR